MRAIRTHGVLLQIPFRWRAAIWVYVNLPFSVSLEVNL